MRLTVETLTLFLLLMPGFVSSAVLNTIAVRQAKGRVDQMIEALVFSFLIYGCLVPFFGGSPVSIAVATVEGETTYRPTADPAFLGWAIGLAVAFALAVGTSITHDLHMKVLRRIGVTFRTARDNTWLDIFSDQERYIEVNFTDGRRLFGWPLYYSNHPDEGLLYVCDAAWIDGKGAYVELNAHGILLTRKDDIREIVFTNLTSGQAEEAHEVAGEGK